MSSLRKIEANRENGKLGGPRTPEGKTKSALNSIKHGLAGNTLLLTNESRPMYNDLLDVFIDRFQPADNVELELVVEMVNARWRLRRSLSIETAMIDLQMDDQEDDIAKDRGKVDELVRVAIAFKSLAEGRGLDLLGRYEARSRRHYEKALAELRALQAERNAKEPKQDPPAPVPVLQIRQTNPPETPAAPSIRPEPPVLTSDLDQIPTQDAEPTHPETS